MISHGFLCILDGWLFSTTGFDFCWRVPGSCFSDFLFLCFCFHCFLIFPPFLLLCFSAFCFACLSAFPASLLFAFLASLLFRFSVFPASLLSNCSSCQSCVCAALLPASLPLCFLHVFGSFSFVFFFLVCILHETLERP